MSVAVVPTDPDQLLASMRRAVYLDPNELLDNPRNLRKEIGEVEDLMASIELVGILCPLIVIPAGEHGDQFQIMMGHRRKKAALKLHLPEVPCWIAESEDAAHQLISQLAENDDRVGFTVSERAEAYHQLTIEGWTPERIATARNITPAQVTQSLTLCQLPAEAQAAADTGVLSLVDAAKLDEFTGDPAALARILKAASGGWGLRHAIAAERDKKIFATAKEQTKARLVLDGVKVTAKPKGYPHDGPARSATALMDPAGNRLDADAAKRLPGFAAFIQKNGTEALPVVYCADPEGFGYRPYSSPTDTSGVAADAQAVREAEASERAEYLAGLARAEEVRREFYQSTYGSAKAAKKLFVEALRAFATDTDLPLFTEPGELYTVLGGADDAVLAGAGEDRLRRALVARWICAQETNLAVASLDHTWDLNTEAAGWWLDQLVADAYVLSDAETTLRASLDDDQPDDTDTALQAGEATSVGREDVDLGLLNEADLELVLAAEPVTT